MLVAYRYREPSIVRAYEVNQLSLAALNPQGLALAGVRGVVPICNRNETRPSAGLNIKFIRDSSLT